MERGSFCGYYASRLEWSATSGGLALPPEVSKQTPRQESSDVTEATPPDIESAESNNVYLK
ncbi:hypothetical protein DPMN_056475 [Dreissena polymorpha]|uniref:Uncharacterized protein n=1 Tax=Dreissena polymorpha TaxID=45954 RepID=A0A9D4CRS8_DREPO|nr:hypothetical protein DPMN_056475 [Dreissena polymorpha]